MSKSPFSVLKGSRETSLNLKTGAGKLRWLQAFKRARAGKEWLRLPPISWSALFAFGAVSLFYAYQFALRVAPSVMGDYLIKDFALDASSYGFLASSYYYGYAFFQVPSGSLLDIFGCKRVVMSFIFMCLFGVVLSLSYSLSLVYVGRFFIGVGSAVSFIACVKVASTYFAARYGPFLMGVAVFMGTLGAMGGGPPVALSLEHVGWRMTTVFLGVIALFLIVFAGFSLKKDEPVAFNTTIFKQAGRDFTHLFFKRQTWIIGLYGVLSYVPFAAFCDLWGASFLEKSHDISDAQSSFLVSFIYIGLGVGSPFGAWLLKIMGGYRRCFFLSGSLGAMLFFVFLILPKMSYVFYMIIMFLIGLIASPQILAFPLIATINPMRMGGAASGFHNMICMFSGIVFQPFIGWLMEKDFCLGPLSSMHASLLVIPLALLTSVLLIFFIKEPKAQEG